MQEWLQADRFTVLPGYQYVISHRTTHCLEGEVVTDAGIRLVSIGLSDCADCGQLLWLRLGGAENTRPQEPWCVASLDLNGALTDLEAFDG